MDTITMLKPIEILLVEDSPTDILMTQEAFEQAGLLDQLHVVEDGAAALTFLRQQGQYATARRPDLILLDLNLPKKSGQDVLAELKADRALNFIPVVILTTSKADEDVLKSYGLHANGYITKPIGFTNFVETVQAINNFWFNVVTLPPR
jgi:chemotaxis family two-component system response regulator Rcp1